MNRSTVVLADDHMVVREGLRKLLEAKHDIEVVGEAATGREAVDLARKVHPAVIVMDIAMPRLNGCAREPTPGAPMPLIKWEW